MSLFYIPMSLYSSILSLSIHLLFFFFFWYFLQGFLLAKRSKRLIDDNLQLLLWPYYKITGDASVTTERAMSFRSEFDRPKINDTNFECSSLLLCVSRPRLCNRKNNTWKRGRNDERVESTALAALMDTKREGPAPFARAEERWMESVCWTSRSFVNALTCEKKGGGGWLTFPISIFFLFHFLLRLFPI